MPLDYSKWDKLDWSSDSDDCHPNIDKDTWKRLKQRRREELGIQKKEIYLVDKWNTTSVNKRPGSAGGHDHHHHDHDHDHHDCKEHHSSEQQTSSESKENAPPQQQPPSTQTTTAPTSDDVAEVTDAMDEMALEHRAEAVAEALDFEARSNPMVFLENHRSELEQFAKIKNDKKAERFLKKNGHLLHEASEGYLITRAVDLAVEGDETGKCRVARRCLQIHNLVLSCKQANVKAETGAEMFFQRLQNPTMEEEYRREFEKQYVELLGRIDERRVERLAEMQAPAGPGGLDPTEVLNELPEEMQRAFIEKDTDMLRSVLSDMDPEKAQYYMDRCIASGLWVDNSGDVVDDDELAAARDIPNDLQ